MNEPKDAMPEPAPTRGALDLLSPRLLFEHRDAVGVLVARAKRIGGVLTVLVMSSYVAAGLVLWRVEGSSGVWAALVIATLAFLFFRQMPAVALAFARMPDRGRPELAALHRAIDLALDARAAREVLRTLDDVANQAKA